MALYACGGNADELKDADLVTNDHKRSDVGKAVGQMVIKTAAVRCGFDLDLIQAAYNWIYDPLFSRSGGTVSNSS